MTVFCLRLQALDCKAARLLAAVTSLTFLTAACGDGVSRKAGGAAEARRGAEVDRAVNLLLSPPNVRAETGFKATLLVPPGKMYDPIAVIPRAGGVWVND